LEVILNKSLDSVVEKGLRVMCISNSMLWKTKFEPNVVIMARKEKNTQKFLSNGKDARFEFGFIERFRPKRGRTRERKK
jgi:hypothetical protein